MAVPLLPSSACVRWNRRRFPAPVNFSIFLPVLSSCWRSSRAGSLSCSISGDLAELSVSKGEGERERDNEGIPTTTTTRVGAVAHRRRCCCTSVSGRPRPAHMALLCVRHHRTALTGSLSLERGHELLVRPRRPPPTLAQRSPSLPTLSLSDDGGDDDLLSPFCPVCPLWPSLVF